ncbi:MAG: addiction module protein [Acidobacteriota bacterium]
MSQAAEEIPNDALRLSTAERAEVVTTLLASLEGEPEENVEAAWASEIEQRANRVRSGAARGRTWSEVRNRLQKRSG